MTTALPARDQVAKEHTWNLESLFASDEAWRAAYARCERQLRGLRGGQGKIGRSSAELLRWLRAYERIMPGVLQVRVFAAMRSDEDTANQHYSAMNAMAQGLWTRAVAATAFSKPELLAVKPATLRRFLREQPALRRYAHFFDDLQRQRAHVRSAEVEEVLARAGDALGTPRNVYAKVTDADLKFGLATGRKDKVEVARGNVQQLLAGTDRRLRKSAFERYSDGFLGLRNTFAEIFAGKVKSTVYQARCRGFPNALSYALHEHNIPTAVYHNVIDACNRHLPVWHRYWEAKRRALGLQALELCDVFAPIAQQPRVPYAQAVDWICAGMRPLGEDYVRVAREGLTTRRWVDIYPNRGKRNGAYSSGVYGTQPFILMSYSENGLFSMSTLAHELGHSMHSHLAYESQPFIYAEYSLFVAEVASNFNQALTRAHLLGQRPEKAFQFAVVEETMSNFYRYLFLMPILSQFELWMHTAVERGGALTADEMIATLAGLFKRGYGPAVQVDEPRAGIIWAQFQHFFSDFYVHQYASGIAAANALADMVLGEGAPAAERYLAFLKAGGSVYPLDALKIAGIDMSSPAPMDRAFKVLEGFVERLEGLM